MTKRLEEPTPRKLLLAAAALLIFDALTDASGGSTVPGGPLDELAHLLSALLVVWALGPKVCRRLLAPALITSVAIDIDHIPDRLGVRLLTAGTPRPYTHSLTTIFLLLLAAVILRRRRDLLLGISLGLAIHFFRDMAEPHSGVALLWPFSDHSFSVSHWVYLVTMATMMALSAARLRAAAGGLRSLSSRRSQLRALFPN